MFTLLINLDSRPDRLAVFRERADSIGLRFERMPALDGSRPEFAHAAARIPPTPIGEVIGPRALACIESHRLAWRRIAEGHEMGAVLEDDTYLAEDVGRLLAEPSWVPADAHVVRLETMLTRAALGPCAARTPTGREVRRLRSIHMGGAGYVLTREGARRLHAGTDPVFDTIDRMMFDFRTPLSRGLRIYQMVPGACVQADLAGGAAPEWGLSDINAERYTAARALDANRRPVHDANMAARHAWRRGRKLGQGLWAALRHGARYRRVPYSAVPPDAVSPGAVPPGAVPPDAVPPGRAPR